MILTAECRALGNTDGVFIAGELNELKEKEFGTGFSGSWERPFSSYCSFAQRKVFAVVFT